jgi:aminoglycoside phosphotransferase (APT) family kinase protein
MLDHLVEVGETHRIDVAALERYLRAHVEGVRGPVEVRQFRGGQSNPTYYVKAGATEFVLRRKPPGKLLPSAHAVDREYRVITALAGTDVPVPRTYAFCPDESVLGTPFYIMECVHGRIFRDPRLLEVPRAARRPIYAAMLEVLARLHRLDWRALGLADFGKPASYFARQIHRWTGQYRASETERIEAMERLIEWMPAHVPAGDETTIVHGDYRLGNMVIHPTEPRVLAVLDWELSTLGHPLADLAYTCTPYHLGKEGYSLQDADPAALGLPTESEMVAAYCRLTGRPRIADWDFYIAFSLFRLAAISQGIMGRVLAGTANDPHAAEHGARARALADRAWALVEARGRR